MVYRILCNRLPARELGSGLTWFKENGKIAEFSTLKEAGEKVKELSENPRAANVTYSAERFEAE